MEMKIIFDNAGGVTVQAGGWAGYWHDGPEAAEAIAALLDGSSPSNWDSDEDADGLDPTIDQIQSGGYKTVVIKTWGDVCQLDPESGGWINERDLARRLLAIRS